MCDPINAALPHIATLEAISRFELSMIRPVTNVRIARAVLSNTLTSIISTESRMELEGEIAACWNWPYV